MVPVAVVNVEPLLVDTSTSVTVFASVAVPASVLDFVGEVVVIVGAGAVLSEVIENWVAALLLLVAVSFAAPAAMLTVIVPSLVGVTLNE